MPTHNIKKILIYVISIFLIVALITSLVVKWNDFILPYRNIDKASKKFFNIEEITDYELIKHYADRIHYLSFRISKPVFLVDVTYEESVYKEKKSKELENRDIYLEFEIDDFFGIVVSEPKDKDMKIIGFCDELNLIRYVITYDKEMKDFGEDINSFKSELCDYLWFMGCKWEKNRILHLDKEQDMPDDLLWEKKGENIMDDTVS